MTLDMEEPLIRMQKAFFLLLLARQPSYYKYVDRVSEFKSLHSIFLMKKSMSQHGKLVFKQKALIWIRIPIQTNSMIIDLLFVKWTAQISREKTLKAFFQSIFISLLCLSNRYTGTIKQYVPVYSAIKHSGKRLSDLYRQGVVCFFYSIVKDALVYRKKTERCCCWGHSHSWFSKRQKSRSISFLSSFQTPLGWRLYKMSLWSLCEISMQRYLQWTNLSKEWDQRWRGQPTWPFQLSSCESHI